MKALRRKDNHEWLAKTLGPDLFTGDMPMKIHFETIEEMTTFYKEKLEIDIDLSDYELVNITIVVDESDFTSKCCAGERCMCCGQQSTHKIEESVFHDDPYPGRHPLTGYLCDKHFDMVLRPYNDKRNIEEIAKAEWEKIHPDGIPSSSHIVAERWTYWLKAFEIAMRTNIPPRVNLLTEVVQKIADAAAYKDGDEPNDYEHGKHTAANMILDEINEIFYGYNAGPVTPTTEKFTTGIRETEFGVEKGFQAWVQIDHQTFYLMVDEDKDHAQWYLDQTIVALNRLIKTSADGKV